MPQGVERELTAPQNGFLPQKRFCWAYLSPEAKDRVLPGMETFWQRKSLQREMAFSLLDGNAAHCSHTPLSSEQWLLNTVMGEGPRNGRFKAGHGPQGNRGGASPDQQPRWAHDQD